MSWAVSGQNQIHDRHRLRDQCCFAMITSDSLLTQYERCSTPLLFRAAPLLLATMLKMGSRLWTRPSRQLDSSFIRLSFGRTVRCSWQPGKGSLNMASAVATSYNP